MKNATMTTVRQLQKLGVVLGFLLLGACVARYSSDVNDWWQGRGPVVPHGTFPGDCSICHTSDSWGSMRADFEFDHAQETGFKLNGAHEEAQCLRCHNDRGPVQVFSEQGCAGCHGDVHNRRLGDQCLDCHTEQDWNPRGQLAEHARTRFPLFGNHASITCDRCHEGIGSGVFDPLSTECVSCHQADLASAVPNHFDEGWTESCDRCHRPTTWAEEGFVHETFPLIGGHKTDCASCHSNEDFSPVSAQCNDCHASEFQVSTELDHAAFNLPRQCEICHSEVSWATNTFDHSTVGNDCLACHGDDFQATSNPDHSLWGYSTDCVQCHGTTDWEAVNFGHPGITANCTQCHFQDFLQTQDPDHQLWGYPQDCELCHHQFTSFPPGDFFHTGVTNGCVQCHFQDYLMTTDPNHQENFFPTTCEDCHTPDVTWDLGLRPKVNGQDLQTPPAKATPRRGGLRDLPGGRRPRKPKSPH